MPVPGTSSLATVLACALLVAAVGDSWGPAPSCAANPDGACPVRGHVGQGEGDHVLLQVGQRADSPLRKPVAKAKRRNGHVEYVAAAPDSDVRRGDEASGDAGDVDDHAHGREGETAELEIGLLPTGAGGFSPPMGAGSPPMAAGGLSPISPVSALPNWEKRFADSNDNGKGPLSEAILQQLFTKDQWEGAVRTAFGEEALAKADSFHHPSLQPSFDRKASLWVPDEVTPGAGKYKDEELGDHHYNRAMSVANLRKVKKFLELVATGGYIANPNYERGRACAPSNTPCSSDAECAKCTGGTVQHKVPVNEVSMYILDKILVRPLTYHSQLSLVGHIGGGTPRVFISHAWGGHFFSFMRAVESHFTTLGPGANAEDTYYWVCTFAVNQHRAAEEVGTSVYGPFYYGIQLAESVLAIQDDEQAQIFFTLNRPWCAFEMLTTLLFQKPLDFACHSGALFGDDGWVGENGNPAKEGMVCTPDLQRMMLGWSVTSMNSYDQCIGGIAPARGAHVELKPGHPDWCDKALPKIVNFINDRGCEAADTKLEAMDDEDAQLVENNDSGAKCVEELFHMWGYSVSPRERFHHKNAAFPVGEGSASPVHGDLERIQQQQQQYEQTRGGRNPLFWETH